MNDNGQLNGHPKHTDWNKVPVEHWKRVLNANGHRREIDDVSLTHCAAYRHARARYPHEQMTIVERGPVLFTIGDSQQVAQTGDVLHFPSGTARRHHVGQGSNSGGHLFTDTRRLSQRA